MKSGVTGRYVKYVLGTLHSFCPNFKAI